MYSQFLNRICLLLAVILCFAQPTFAETNIETRAVSVLYERFETVIRSQRNILAGSGNLDRISESDATNLRMPFYLLFGGLNFLGPNTAMKIAKKSQSILVGARDFRPPRGLGPVRSMRCYVFVLSPDRPLESSKYFHLKATPSVDERPVWSWSAKLGEFGEEDPRASLLFATQLAQSYLIVSNDLQELRDVSNTLGLPDKSFEGSGISPELDLVRGHSIWGYRRYRFSTPGINRGAQDVVNRASGMGDVKPGTEALSFWIDTNANRGMFRLVDPSTDPHTAGAINARGGLPPLMHSGQGIWEATILLSGNESSSEQLFGVMGMFGFGAYI